jgi:hypothetical protein
MQNDLQHIWELYTSAWNAESAPDKLALFSASLETDCEYTDPATIAKGWNELLSYMLDFQQQVPGAHIKTRYFSAHNFQSIAKWQIKNNHNQILDNGISYGKYSAQGKLISMTGFFEIPEF